MTLEEGVSILGLRLSDDQVDKLHRYQKMLEKWNKVYNLTAVRDPDQILTHHLLDSLAVIPHLLKRFPHDQAFSLLDVGSGGGLPGVVMAICCPQAQVRCVDAVGKKAAFQQQVALELRLPNLSAVHARVETLSAPHDVICSRAFASLADFVTLSKASCAANGVWMALKGKHPDAELALLPNEIQVFHVEPVEVPGLNAERCIVWMRASH